MSYTAQSLDWVQSFQCPAVTQINYRILDPLQSSNALQSSRCLTVAQMNHGALDTPEVPYVHAFKHGFKALCAPQLRCSTVALMRYKALDALR